MLHRRAGARPATVLDGAATAIFACAVGCRPAPSVPIASKQTVAAAAPSSTLWSYQVDATSLDDVAIEASFPEGSDDLVNLDSDVRPFVHDVMIERAEGAKDAAAPTFVPAPARTDASAGWNAGCHAHGCRVRYRLRLRALATTLGSSEEAMIAGDTIVTMPSTWMLRPQSGDGREGGVRFHVVGSKLVTGIDRASDGQADAYQLRVEDIDGASFTVFGDVPVESLKIGASTIDVAILPGSHALDAPSVARWVTADSNALADYYGGYPVPHVLVLIMPTNDKVTRGVTFGDGGPALFVRIGKPVGADTLADDWVITHEMLHVATPSLGRAHMWLNEGLASYVEPFIRARAKMIDDARVWRDLLDGLPQGNPEAGDEGLDKTHTWGRTYWGGALFCLVADVTIRERTKNAKSLDDVLRVIQHQGGTVRAHWTLAHFLDEGDAATGTRVLHELYTSMALAPTAVDLPALYKRLGVAISGATVSFDDAAPLAAIRLSMTRK